MLGDDREVIFHRRRFEAGIGAREASADIDAKLAGLGDWRGETLSRLRALIHAQIDEAGGAIPFWKFMELALYAPGLGYYSASRETMDLFRQQLLRAPADFLTMADCIYPNFSIEGESYKRPLIKDLDDEQLLVFIKEKLQERDPFYTKAKIIVDAFDLDGEKLEEAIRGSR